MNGHVSEKKVHAQPFDISYLYFGNSSALGDSVLWRSGSVKSGGVTLFASTSHHAPESIGHTDKSATEWPLLGGILLIFP